MAALAEVEYWTAGDGARLALRRHPARGTPRGAVILVHGFGEHAGRYGHVAEWLAARGLAVFAADQRGHGRSPGRRGHVERFAQYVADVVALRKLVQAQAPAGQLLLLGHSFGALVVLRYLETAPEGVAGAITTSPFLALAMPVPPWKATLASVLATLWPAAAVPTGMSLEHLSTDPAVAAAVRGDRDCHRVMSPRAWHEIRAAQRLAVDERDRIAVPLFVGYAGDDRIVSPAATRAFAAGLSGAVTVREYAGMYHEILNERDRGRVLADLDDWLARVPCDRSAA